MKKMGLRVHGGQRDGMWEEREFSYMQLIIVKVLAFVLVIEFEGNY